MSEIRTPPSLKWLLNKRAKLAGELDKLQKNYPKMLAAAEEELVEAKGFLEQAHKQVALQKKRFNMQQKALTADLEAIDNTLRQHEIQISPELISPVAPYQSEKLVPYGEITRTIFNCLKFVGDASLSTTDIAVFIASNIDREISDGEFVALRKSVAMRLKNLRYEGKIIKTNSTKNSVEGRWRLPNDGSLPTPLWKRKMLGMD